MSRRKTRARDIKDPEHYFNRTIALEIKNDRKKRARWAAHECSLDEKMQHEYFEQKYAALEWEYEDLLAQLDNSDLLDWIETFKNPDLYSGIKALSHKRQMILTLIFVHGYSLRETSRLMNVSHTAIEKNLEKILKKLKGGLPKR